MLLEAEASAKAAGEEFHRNEFYYFVEDSGQHFHTKIGPKEFFTSPKYMNVQGVLWDAVLEELVTLNDPTNGYNEAVLTGSIGSAKTTVALYTQAYQLYLLSCELNPHVMFKLDPASEILIVMQNMTEKLAKVVDYQRFRSMIERSPYFTNNFMFNKGILSEMQFPNNIIVRPLSGKETAAIGQNVIGGVIDEVNYMDVIKDSSRTGVDGIYDQAERLYNSLARRRESRFLRGGIMPGIVCLMSSERYPDQFTDRKKKEVRDEIKKKGRSATYLYHKRTWDVNPQGTYSAETFRVFVGDHARKPRVLVSKDKIPAKDAELVLEVPLDFKHQFEVDIYNALRDIGGVSTLSTTPFIPNLEAVTNSFGKSPSVVATEWCDFEGTPLDIRVKQIQRKNERHKRFAHVDIGLTHDSCGVAIGYVLGFKKMKRHDQTYETLPFIVFDLVLEVRPPPSGEIILEKVRTMFYKLRDFGMPLTWISYDGYQSADSIQILRSKGFVVGRQSIDKTTGPYDVLKQAFYDGRVVAPNSEVARRELAALELNPKTSKIDHPARGSKDVSDAMAGVVYGLTTRAEVWIEHNIDTFELPPSLEEILVRTREAEEGDGEDDSVVLGSGGSDSVF